MVRDFLEQAADIYIIAHGDWPEWLPAASRQGS